MIKKTNSRIEKCSNFTNNRLPIFEAIIIKNILTMIAILLHWVFVAAGFSLVAVSRGYSLVAMHGLLITAASLVAEHGLSSSGAWV